MKRTIGILRNAVPRLLTVMLTWQTSVAQVDPWERVQLVEPGKKVNVKLDSGKSVNGKMEAWSTDGLTVRHGNDRVIQVTKSDVAEVALVMGMSRGRKATWAGGITCVAVGGLAVAACTSGGCDSSSGSGVAIAGAAVFWGAVAAGIAALFAPHKEVVYRTQRSADKMDGAGKAKTAMLGGTYP